MLDQNSKDLENLKFLLLGLDWHGPTPVVGGKRLSEPGWGNESLGKCEDGKKTSRSSLFESIFGKWNVRMVKNLEELVVWKSWQMWGC